MLPFFLYYKNLINQFCLIFFFNFSCFHFVNHHSFHQFYIYIYILHAFIYLFFCIFNFHLNCLKLFCSGYRKYLTPSRVFHTRVSRVVFHWSLSDNKFPQVSRTLLSILAYLNNAVVWMVSTCSLISKFPSPFTNYLRGVLSPPITTSITVMFMFHIFF